MAQHDWIERPVDDREPVQEWEHPLVKELVPDPHNLPELEVLYGYLGRSPFVGHRRLYLDERFKQCFDILDYMIVKVVQLDPAVSMHAKHVIWVDRRYPAANGHPYGPWFP
jgi:hypothetical protein